LNATYVIEILLLELSHFIVIIVIVSLGLITIAVVILVEAKVLLSGAKVHVASHLPSGFVSSGPCLDLDYKVEIAPTDGH
jgi:hypothetical protein